MCESESGNQINWEDLSENRRKYWRDKFADQGFVIVDEEGNPVDLVNHPPHYCSHPSGVEVITITEHMGFCLDNVIKYVLRADLKGDAIEDLRKAAWYLDREIARRERERDA
jgi:hypothetical protein